MGCCLRMPPSFRKRNSQVGVCFGIVRLERYRHLVLLDGFCAAAAFGQSDAEIIACFGKARI